MNILFVFDNLSEAGNANIIIGTELASRMKQGNRLIALTKNGDGLVIDTKKRDVFDKVISFNDIETDVINEIMSLPFWKKASLKRRVGYLLCHPKQLIYATDLWYGNSAMTEKNYISNIENICKEMDVDAVVGISFPYYIMSAIAKSHIKCYKIAIQLDPYTFNYSLSKYNRHFRKNTELKTISSIDEIYAATAVAKEMRTFIPEKDLYKIQDFEIPGISKELYINNASDNNSKNESLRFDCYYLGVLYRDIRNPDYMLRLFTALPDSFYLHLIGEGAEDVIAQYVPVLKDRLIIHGKVSSFDAAQLMRKADLLINLNNSVKNQVPSKLFQYVSTGKPILNICKIENCPSLDYIKNYRNSVTIHETERIDVAVKKVVSFTEKDKNNKITWEEIERNFQKNTYDFAAANLYHHLETKC